MLFETTLKILSIPLYLMIHCCQVTDSLFICKPAAHGEPLCFKHRNSAFERHADGQILCFKNNFPDLTCLTSPRIFETQNLFLSSTSGQHFLRQKSLCLNSLSGLGLRSPNTILGHFLVALITGHFKKN